MFQYLYNNNSTFNIIFFKIVAFGKQWLNYTSSLAVVS